MWSSFLSQTMLAMDSVMHISLSACAVLEKNTLYPSPHSKKWGRISLGILSLRVFTGPSHHNKKCCYAKHWIQSSVHTTWKQKQVTFQVDPTCNEFTSEDQDQQQIFFYINVIQIFLVTFIAIKGWNNGSNKCLLGLWFLGWCFTILEDLDAILWFLCYFVCG